LSVTSALAELIRTIRWQDAVDILLNSYILFRLYVLLRGTNIFHVLIGIVMLWLFQRGAVALGLIVTSWVLQGLTAVTVLIIIVVFSAEIRSLFATRSLRYLLWGIDRRDQSADATEEIIADAIFEMARKHVGALVVIPGQKAVSGFIRNGIPWRGILSKEMLLTIFWHNNPVHDGAAIIRGDRVTEVGAILPLSQRMDLPKYYGTRHRAAIGMSEVSDALVIAASEERGVVVSAHEGQVEVMSNRSALKDRIETHLGPRRRPWLMAGRDRMKLAAAGMASLLFIGGIWFVMSRGMSALITLETPVEYVDRAENMEIINTSVDRVRLHLSGSQMLLQSLRPEQIRVRINLRKASVGYNVFPITDDNIVLPPGIMLTKVEPRILEMQVDARVTRAVPVQVKWSGTLREDLIMTAVRITPRRVEITGTSRAVDRVSTIYTEPVPLGPITGDGRTAAALALDGENIRPAPTAPGQVTVEYEVRPRL
jgi:diadenylate cyclase